MKCTIDEQETCDVEKRGCEGCYYDDSKIKEAIEYLKKRNENYKLHIKQIDLTKNIYGTVVVKEYHKKQQAIETVLNYIDRLENEQKTCLHCGSGEAAYCEDCFQKLIAENAKLQRGIKQC